MSSKLLHNPEDNRSFLFTGCALSNNDKLKAGEAEDIDDAIGGITDYEAKQLDLTGIRLKYEHLPHEFDPVTGERIDPGDMAYIGEIIDTIHDYPKKGDISFVAEIPPEKGDTELSIRRHEHKNNAIQAILNGILKDVSVSHRCAEYKGLEDGNIQAIKEFFEVSLTKEGRYPDSNMFNFMYETPDKVKTDKEKRMKEKQKDIIQAKRSNRCISILDIKRKTDTQRRKLNSHLLKENTCVYNSKEFFDKKQQHTMSAAPPQLDETAKKLQEQLLQQQRELAELKAQREADKLELEAARAEKRAAAESRKEKLKRDFALMYDIAENEITDLVSNSTDIDPQNIILKKEVEKSKASGINSLEWMLNNVDKVDPTSAASTQMLNNLDQVVASLPAVVTCNNKLMASLKNENKRYKQMAEENERKYNDLAKVATAAVTPPATAITTPAVAPPMTTVATKQPESASVPQQPKDASASATNHPSNLFSDFTKNLELQAAAFNPDKKKLVAALD